MSADPDELAEEEPQQVPLRDHIHHLKTASLQIDQTIQRTNRKIQKLLKERAKILTELGEWYGTNCARCKEIIAWSGRGKRPLFCSECKQIRRREYCKNWRRQHLDHVRAYTRRYRQRSKHQVHLMDDEPNPPDPM